MDTTVCQRCGGIGEYWAIYHAQKYEVLNVCPSCRGLGHVACESPVPLRPLATVKSIVDKFFQERKDYEPL